MNTFSLADEARRKELWAALALRNTKGIGGRRAYALIERFHSAFAAVSAVKKSPQAWGGLIPEPVIREFLSELWREPALEEWKAIKNTNVSFLLLSESLYPVLLKEICDAPLLLYYSGNISLIYNPMIGVVGSRDCTREGMRVAVFFARALSLAGITIVSGMARGIDRAAHLAGLSGPGSSIAVLGTGVDVVYPAENSDLAKLMHENGLILSEYAPGEKAHAKHFPVRNRIISGLSLGALIVEASKHSGSLITARLCLEQNREVFAVPGHTTAPVSAGCRELIRKGAKPVFTAEDILLELAPLLSADIRQREEAKKCTDHNLIDELSSTLIEEALPLPLFSASNNLAKESIEKKGSVKENVTQKTLRLTRELTVEEENIFRLLEQGDVHIDELCCTLDMSISHLSGILARMEIKKEVIRKPGMIYAIL